MDALKKMPCPPSTPLAVALSTGLVERISEGLVCVAWIHNKQISQNSHFPGLLQLIFPHQVGQDQDYHLSSRETNLNISVSNWRRTWEDYVLIPFSCLAYFVKVCALNKHIHKFSEILYTYMFVYCTYVTLLHNISWPNTSPDQQDIGYSRVQPW